MPTLTPLIEEAESLNSLTEGSEVLSVMVEGSESLQALVELVYESTIRLGFFPATSLYEAPYPFPGSISYPGDTTGSVVGETLTVLSEGAETLTPLTED